MVIFVRLYGLALLAGLLAGYGMSAAKSRNWLHMIGLAATMALAVHVVIDSEYRRLRLIRVDTFGQVSAL